MRRVVAGIVRRTVEKPPQLGEDFAALTLLLVAELINFYFGRSISTLQFVAGTFHCNSLILGFKKLAQHVQ